MAAVELLPDIMKRHLAWEVGFGFTAGVIAMLVGAALGATLPTTIPAGVIELALAFGLAALLYLVTEELLVSAHEEPEHPVATAVFFGGFLLFLLIGMQT